MHEREAALLSLRKGVRLWGRPFGSPRGRGRAGIAFLAHRGAKREKAPGNLGLNKKRNPAGSQALC